MMIWVPKRIHAMPIIPISPCAPGPLLPSDGTLLPNDWTLGRPPGGGDFPSRRNRPGLSLFSFIPHSPLGAGLVYGFP